MTSEDRVMNLLLQMSSFLFSKGTAAITSNLEMLEVVKTNRILHGLD